MLELPFLIEASIVSKPLHRVQGTRDDGNVHISLRHCLLKWKVAGCCLALDQPAGYARHSSEHEFRARSRAPYGNEVTGVRHLGQRHVRVGRTYLREVLTVSFLVNRDAVACMLENSRSEVSWREGLKLLKVKVSILILVDAIPGQCQCYEFDCREAVESPPQVPCLCHVNLASPCRYWASWAAAQSSRRRFSLFSSFPKESCAKFSSKIFCQE